MWGECEEEPLRLEVPGSLRSSVGSGYTCMHLQGDADLGDFTRQFSASWLLSDSYDFGHASRCGNPTQFSERLQVYWSGRSRSRCRRGVHRGVRNSISFGLDAVLRPLLDMF
jgi:hypothetical protein